MTLPAHLAKYDGLLDLLVDALVREVTEGSPETRKPAADQSSRVLSGGLDVGKHNAERYPAAS